MEWQNVFGWIILLALFAAVFAVGFMYGYKYHECATWQNSDKYISRVYAGLIMALLLAGSVNLFIIAIKLVQY